MAYFKFSIVLFFIFSSLITFSQTKLNKGNVVNRENPFANDSSVNKRSKGFKRVASIDMYLLFNEDKDTVTVDTTLSIKKEYKFNYLQKDNFGLMPFANMGQTYNSLSVNTSNEMALPQFSARARHFNYYEVKDIMYYEVPTPWTRLTYKTAFEQGQMLDAFIALNLSKQFNFSIAYKGLRSLGNYQNALTSSGNFRFTANFKSKNNKYKAKGHIVMQDLLNQENGGLDDEGIDSFVSGEEEFLDRSVFEPNFTNAENILVGKRFYLNQSYKLLSKNDSLNNTSLALNNIIQFEDKYYQFYQPSPVNDFFGDSFTNDIDDKVTLENFETAFGLNFYNRVLGELQAQIYYTDINYGYNGVVLFPGQVIPNRIKSNFISVGSTYNKDFGKLKLTGNARYNLTEEFSGNYISTAVNFQLNKEFNIGGGLRIESRLPNYNQLLYQSDYINYNWYNANTFNNVKSQQINFIVKSKTYLNAFLEINNIDNYTYFNLEDTIDKIRIIKPKQYSNTLQYLKLRVDKELKFGNLALDNSIMYQNVVGGEGVLNVPSIITRNTLYYTNKLFKKAMTLQTGVTLNYFTKYNMNGYDPLLAEFYAQNETKLGGFPMLDFFIDAKIRQTRIFFKAEHFNSSITGYEYFSAPNHPYRDFTIRFGLVWDFFL